MEDPDVIKITEIFLIPESILIGAIGVAETEPLKTGLSLAILISAFLWQLCALDARPPKSSLRVNVLVGLPTLFIIGAAISFVVHVTRWHYGF